MVICSLNLHRVEEAKARKKTFDEVMQQVKMSRCPGPSSYRVNIPSKQQQAAVQSESKRPPDIETLSKELLAEEVTRC